MLSWIVCAWLFASSQMIGYVYKSVKLLFFWWYTCIISVKVTVVVSLIKRKTVALKIVLVLTSHWKLVPVAMENMDDEQLNSLDQQKRSCIFGVILIAASLVLGKLLLIPLILFPGDKHWYVAMLVVYLFSWLMLIPGIVLAGIEGYRLVMTKYKD